MSAAATLAATYRAQHPKIETAAPAAIEYSPEIRAKATQYAKAIVDDLLAKSAAGEDLFGKTSCAPDTRYLVPMKRVVEMRDCAVYVDIMSQADCKALGRSFEDAVAATADELRKEGLELFTWRPGPAISGYVYCADVAREHQSHDGMDRP